MESLEVKHDDVVVNGVRIHYRLAGRGPAVVLLHGCFQTSHEWRHLMPALSRNRTVIAPDLRGMGQSEKPGVGYDALTMTEDIRQLLCHLKLDVVDMIGHDLGGAVAFIYAAMYGAGIRRLGIVEMPFPGIPSALVERAVASYWHFGFLARPGLAEVLLAGNERDFVADHIRAYQYNMSAPDDTDIDEYARHVAAPGGIAALAGPYRAGPTQLRELQRLAKIKLKMPVLALAGDHSLGSGQIEQMKQLALDVSGGVIDDSGHWVVEEQPHQVMRWLETFLDASNSAG
jgi:pimeloyl-ACP methyl ester carboxylesterase